MVLQESSYICPGSLFFRALTDARSRSRDVRAMFRTNPSASSNVDWLSPSVSRSSPSSPSPRSVLLLPSRMRRTLQRTPSQASTTPAAAGAAAETDDTSASSVVAVAVAPPGVVSEAPATRILKNAASRAAAAAAAAASASAAADSSPVAPAISPEPLSVSVSSGSWDLSDLIAQYATASPSPSPDADDADGDCAEVGDAEGECEGEEHIEPEPEAEERVARTVVNAGAPRRIVSLVGTSSNGGGGGTVSRHSVAANASLRSDRAEDRLAPNTRFLGNLLRGTLSHNERVEHVVLAMRGCDSSSGLEAEAAEITVYDPRGTYNGLSLSKSAAASANANANANANALSNMRAAAGRNMVLSHDPSAVAAPGSLAAEARKLMEAFEGSSVGGGGGGVGVRAPARKVRGRGRALAGMKDSTCNVAVRDDVDMTEMATQRTNIASSSAAGVKGTVAASHLHTPEQRQAYQQTHDKYKRARGVTLLHHIAKAYGISIVIQPAGTVAESSDDEEIEAAATLLEKQAAKAKAASALAATATAPAPAAAVPATASRPARLFATSLGNLGQPAVRSVSNPSADTTVPAASSTQSSDGGARVRITLQRTIVGQAASSQSPAPSPPAASASPPAPVVRRTFDAPLVASPESMSDNHSAPPLRSIEIATVNGNANHAATATAAATGRKMVTLSARSGSQGGGGSTVAASAAASAAAPAASSQPQSRVLSTGAAAGRPLLQLNHKRKGSDEDAATGNGVDSPAASASPPASSGASTLSASSPAMVRSSSLGATPAAAGGSNVRGASIPLAKRKRTGGILGAALSGILGGSAR